MKIKSYTWVILMIVTLLIVVSGCVSQRENMISQGYPPAYADGYDDGCHSGSNAGGSIIDQFTKNVKRYKEDSQYRQGWDDGYKQCKAKQDAFQKQYQTSIEQQRLIEEKRHNKKIEEDKLLKGIDTHGLENLK